MTDYARVAFYSHMATRWTVVQAKPSGRIVQVWTYASKADAKAKYDALPQGQRTLVPPKTGDR